MCLYGIAYAIAALVLLRCHRGHVQALYSNLRGVNLPWLIVLAILNTLVWIAALVAFVIRMTGVTEAHDVILRAGRLMDVTGTPAMFPMYGTLTFNTRW